MPLKGKPILSTMLSSWLGRNGRADRLLDLFQQAGGLFDPRARLGAHMHQDLAGINRREEILAQERRQPERQHDAGQKRCHEGLRVAQCIGQERAVAAAEPLEPRLEALLEAQQRIAGRRRRHLPDMAFHAVMAVHQIIGHGRHQSPRQDERADQREHDGFGQRPEQVSRDAAKLEHRHEHDAEAEQGHKGRHDDLLRAVQDRRFDVLALLQVVVDVFDRHRSVVDQDADGERQTAERHDVDGLAEGRQRDQREQDGKRDFREDDDRRTPAAQKQQDHDADQCRGQHRLANDAEHRGFDEDGLIAHGMEIEARGQALLDTRQQRFDPVDDIEGRRRSRLQDGHQHRARAIDADQLVCGGEPWWTKATSCT